MADKWRKVQVRFWTDPEVLDMTPEDKLFFLYLLTNRNTTAIGCFEFHRKTASAETGYNTETVETLLQRFIDYGKVLYDRETREVLILNWLKYNPPSASPKWKKLYETELAAIKSERFRSIVKTGLDEGEIRRTHQFPIDLPMAPAPSSGDVAHSEPHNTPAPAKRINRDALPDSLPDLIDASREIEEAYVPSGNGSYPQPWTGVCQKALDVLRGTQDTGTGYNATAKACKEAWKGGYKPAQWIMCAEALFDAQRAGLDWLPRITGPTVTKLLPDWMAGTLVLKPKEGQRPRKDNGPRAEIEEQLEDLRRQYQGVVERQTPYVDLMETRGHLTEQEAAEHDRLEDLLKTLRERAERLKAKLKDLGR